MNKMDFREEFWEVWYNGELKEEMIRENDAVEIAKALQNKGGKATVYHVRIEEQKVHI